MICFRGSLEIQILREDRAVLAMDKPAGWMRAPDDSHPVLECSVAALIAHHDERPPSRTRLPLPNLRTTIEPAFIPYRNPVLPPDEMLRRAREFHALMNQRRSRWER